MRFLSFIQSLSMMTLAIGAAFANAPPCETPKIASLINKPYTWRCSAASEYDFVKLTLPSTATLEKMCTIQGCVDFFMALVDLNLGNCTVGMFNIPDAIDTFETTCGINFSSDASMSGSSDTVTVAVGSTSTTASTGSSGSSTSSASSSGSSGSSSSTPADVSTTSGVASAALAPNAMIFVTAMLALFG